MPKAAAYILSDQSMATSILGDNPPMLTDQEISQFSPELLRALAAQVYTGRDLQTGAWNELDTLWEQLGQPQGDLEKWVKSVVIPTIKGNT